MAELFGKSTGTIEAGTAARCICSTRTCASWAATRSSVADCRSRRDSGLSILYKEEPEVVCCFFGDGALPQGAFHESLNMASLWKLPVIFICENNFYGMGTMVQNAICQEELYRFAEPYKMPGVRVDGMDVLEVYRAATEAAAHAREGDGPSLIEAVTYRFRGHSMSDPAEYRSRREERIWQERDPIKNLRRKMLHDGRANRSAPRRDREGSRRGDRRRSEVRRRESRTAARRNRQACLRRVDGRGDAAMAQITYREALNQALREELDRDERVFIMGEEVGYFGGAFKVTDGLLAVYGEKRVRDTPISELTIVGSGIGAAMGGLKPIVELMTINFGLLGDRSDRQQRREDPLHVRRQRQRADRDSRAAGCGPSTRRAAQPEPRSLFPALPGTARGDSGHSGRRQGSAQDLRPPGGPGDFPRA